MLCLGIVLSLYCHRSVLYPDSIKQLSFSCPVRLVFVVSFQRRQSLNFPHRILESCFSCNLLYILYIVDCSGISLTGGPCFNELPNLSHHTKCRIIYLKRRYHRQVDRCEYLMEDICMPFERHEDTQPILCSRVNVPFFYYWESLLCGNMLQYSCAAFCKYFSCRLRLALILP